MKFTDVCKLLWDTDKWKQNKPSIFDDDLITKDLSVRLYAEPGVCLREGQGEAVIYETGLFSHMIVKALCHRLLRAVRASSSVPEGEGR